MLTLYKKELKQFFGNTSGYIIISVFLLFCVLYLFFFENDFNILNSEIASLDSFFVLSPWALMILIPALSMRSFAEEKQSGTIELLLTQPISKISIVFAKYFAIISVSIFAIILTGFFVFALQQLTYQGKILDYGIILSSYLGLFLIASSFSAIGVYISSLFKNTVTVYLLSLFISFFFYFGFSNLASYNLFGTYDYIVDKLGFVNHYLNFTKGILSVQSVLYFLTVLAVFIIETYFALLNSKKKLMVILLPFILLIIGCVNFGRLDLTLDERYTLTETTKDILESVDESIKFEIYLDGDFPADLRIFRNEIEQHLIELKNLNSKLEYQFIDPFEEENTVEKLNKQNISPIIKRVKTDKGAKEFYIFPYAKAICKGKQLVFPLIKDANLPIEDNVENIEFNFTKAIVEVTKQNKSKIGVFIHHNEFDPKAHQLFYKKLSNKYDIEPFVPTNKNKLTSEESKGLNKYDALLIIDPQSEFSDTDREAIDQFVMNGGKTMWLIDGVNIKLDSLYKTGKSTVIGKELGLTKLLFNYGVRVNPNLIRDFSQNAPISLITDKYNGKPVFTDFDWYYNPLSKYSPNSHPIVENIAPVRFEFVSTIDTLDVKGINKKVLLSTSEATSVQGTLSEVNLGMVDLEPNLSEFNQQNKIMAVLLEGEFESAFKNRVHSFDYKYKEMSQENKMIVVSDGDIAKSESSKGIKSIGGDRTGFLYGNEDFLMNSIEYLLDQKRVFKLKNKTLNILYLDPGKIQESKGFWKWYCMLMPMIILWIIGFLVIGIRYKLYSK